MTPFHPIQVAPIPCLPSWIGGTANTLTVRVVPPRGREVIRARIVRREVV